MALLAPGAWLPESQAPPRAWAPSTAPLPAPYHPAQRWLPAEIALRWTVGAAALVLALRGLRPEALRPGLMVPLNLGLALLFAANLELAARHSLDSQARSLWIPDSRRLWRARPNLDADARPGWHVRTDSHGFRSRTEVPARPPEGRFRIVTLGDSWTFGFGVDDGEAWPDRLAAHLGERVEVVNASCFGYGVYQGLLSLQDPVLDLQPDLVLIANYRNDETLPYFEALDRRLASPWLGPVLRVLQRSATWQWARREAQARASGPGGAPAPAGFETEVYARMMEEARNAGILVACLQVRDAPGGNRSQERAAERLGVPRLEVPLEGLSWKLPEDPVHCNASTHDLIARKTADFLRTRRLLRP